MHESDVEIGKRYRLIERDDGNPFAEKKAPYIAEVADIKDGWVLHNDVPYNLPDGQEKFAFENRSSKMTSFVTIFEPE